MKIYNPSHFLTDLVPVSQVLLSYWRQVVVPQWPDTRTYLKSLLAHEDGLKALHGGLGKEITTARLLATLGYLDQYSRLPPQFSSFTEFAVAAALSGSEVWLKDATQSRVLRNLGRLDQFVHWALFADASTWREQTHLVQHSLDSLRAHAGSLHPALALSQASSSHLRVA